MAPERTLILASTSPYRRTLLERLNIPFEVASPNVDEDSCRHMEPEAMVRHLARAKAKAIPHPDALVIGSDQCVDLGGEILGKPGTSEAAIAQLQQMAGRAHRLLTAVAIHDTRTGETRDALDVHVLIMRALTQGEIETYVAQDQPLNCAGSYKLEEHGRALFEHIQPDPSLPDETAIIGLPLERTLELLRVLGADLPSKLPPQE
jgi:septum formation protein